MSVAAESPVPTVPTVPKRRRRLSLRARLVLLSTAGLAVGLVVGGVALTAALRIGLEQASDDAAAQTAQEVVTLIDSDRLPDPVPVGGTTLVQVVDRQGRVLAASSGADRLVPALRGDVDHVTDVQVPGEPAVVLPDREAGETRLGTGPFELGGGHSGWSRR